MLNMKSKIMPKDEWDDAIKGIQANCRTMLKDKKEAKVMLKEAIFDAVRKNIERANKKKFGILFSGGVDSSTIALICKKMNADFICYCVGLKDSEDVVSAEKAAKKIGVKLKTKILDDKDVEKTIKILAGMLPEFDIVKAGVGCVTYEGMKLAKKDGVDLVFTGLGSEEIFAGYQRHIEAKDKNIRDLNEECWNGLFMMHGRDLMRDLVIAENMDMDIATPFLDKEVIEIAMKIPGEWKIDEKDNEKNKLILREIAEEIGLPKDIAFRKKRAAQYGSRVDKVIEKLAKKGGFRTKGDYLMSLDSKKDYKKANLGVLLSSGKDSNYAMHLMKEKGFNISCLISLKSRNPYSYMFHTPNIDIAKLQAEALGLPLIEADTEGEKEIELKDLEKAINKAKEKYRINGIVTGALYSNYQRQRIEDVCKRLGLDVYSPLWHKNQEDYLYELVDNGFKFIIVAIAAEGLNKTWLGKEIGKDEVEKLIGLARKKGLNPAGEGGEFESLVLDSPMFRKRIRIIDYNIVEEGKNNAVMQIKKAALASK